MKKFKNKEQGAILIFTLLIMLILMILGMTMLPLTVMEYKTSQNFSDYEKVYFVAEAGVEEAIAGLDASWENYTPKNDWQPLEDEVGEEQGQFKVSLEDTGESFRIVTSTGKVGNIERTIKAEVERPKKQHLEELTKYAIFAQGDLDLDNRVIINGDINVIGTLVNDDPEITGEISKTPIEFNVNSYIQSLENNEDIKNKVKEKSNNQNDSYDLSNNIFSKTEVYPVYVLEDFKSVTLQAKKTFTGLLILKNIDILDIRDGSIFNGIIISVNDSKTTGIKVTGNGNATINGNIISITNNVTVLNENGDLTIHYMDTSEFLPNVNNSTLKINYWREIP